MNLVEVFMSIIIPIIFYIIGLFILYMVIETAVRKGINSSVIGEFLEKKYGIKDERNTIKDDLDNK